MTQLQNTFVGMEPLDTKARLEAKYIVPPFSVLDTRQGYWQERKRLWLSLGFKSEIGRDDSLCFNTKDWKDEKNKGGGQIQVSIFDPVLCELVYKWFCPSNGIILDPFAGGSVRGIVASLLGYDYHGIDLSQAQIEANKEQAKAIVPNKTPLWYVGDADDMDAILPVNFKADLIFSCPPYHDLEQYTDDMDDLSNMSWNIFKKKYSDIIAKAILKLKDNRFACFVVGEIRDKDGGYKGLVPFTITAFLAAGMRYYNEAVLINTAGSLPIRIASQFTYRKIGKMHQNVLVFYKGNMELIPKYFKGVDIGIDYQDDVSSK